MPLRAAVKSFTAADCFCRKQEWESEYVSDASGRSKFFLCADPKEFLTADGHGFSGKDFDANFTN